MKNVRKHLKQDRLTNSPSWREFDWKVKMQNFITPCISAKHSNTTEMCWRDCGLVGELMQIYWECAKIQDFWTNVQKEIKQVLDIDSAFDPARCILGIFPDKRMDGDVT